MKRVLSFSVTHFGALSRPLYDISVVKIFILFGGKAFLCSDDCDVALPCLVAVGLKKSLKCKSRSVAHPLSSFPAYLHSFSRFRLSIFCTLIIQFVQCQVILRILILAKRKKSQAFKLTHFSHFTLSMLLRNKNLTFFRKISRE